MRKKADVDAKPEPDALRRPQLVLVEWEDSYNGDHNWFRLSELPKVVEPAVLYTTGFLVQDGAERLTLSMSWQAMPSDDGHDARLCDLFTIPRGCVRRVTVLRK